MMNKIFVTRLLGRSSLGMRGKLMRGESIPYQAILFGNYIKAN